MDLWEILKTVMAGLLILIVVLATMVAVIVGVIVIGGLIVMAKEQRQQKKLDALPDKMMQQAEIGLKEKEERNEGD